MTVYCGAEIIAVAWPVVEAARVFVYSNGQKTVGTMCERALP